MFHKLLTLTKSLISNGNFRHTLKTFTLSARTSISPVGIPWWYGHSRMRRWSTLDKKWPLQILVSTGDQKSESTSVLFNHFVNTASQQTNPTLDVWTCHEQILHTNLVLLSHWTSPDCPCNLDDRLSCEITQHCFQISRRLKTQKELVKLSKTTKITFLFCFY